MTDWGWWFNDVGYHSASGEKMNKITLVLVFVMPKWRKNHSIFL
jgi:hypothetical protein